MGIGRHNQWLSNAWMIHARSISFAANATVGLFLFDPAA
jgi:hypothetical protein